MPWSDSQSPRLRNTVARWMSCGGDLKELVSSSFPVSEKQMVMEW